jgi:hypothetical protein
MAVRRNPQAFKTRNAVVCGFIDVAVWAGIAQMTGFHVDTRALVAGLVGSTLVPALAAVFGICLKVNASYAAAYVTQQTINIYQAIRRIAYTFSMGAIFSHTAVDIT